MGEVGQEEGFGRTRLDWGYSLASLERLYLYVNQRNKDISCIVLSRSRPVGGAGCAHTQSRKSNTRTEVPVTQRCRKAERRESTGWRVDEGKDIKQAGLGLIA